MATFEIPAEPTADRVWLLDHPKHDCPLLVTRDSIAPPLWDVVGKLHSWPELLALGTVTDVDPDDVSWLSPGPWTAKNEAVVRNASGDIMASTSRAPDHVDAYRLAALIARLVNEHVARHSDEDPS
jgi:hypothetical protein